MRWVSVGMMFVVGCSGSSAPPPAAPMGKPAIAGLKSIAVQPPNQRLVIDGASPATQAYSAIGTFSDGTTRDVTDQVQFQVEDATLGAFANASFTSNLDHGGLTNVVAVAGDALATTGLTLVMRQRIDDPSSTVPADAAQKFTGAGDPTRAPDVVYPNDGVLVPPNLGRLEVHFQPGAGNTLFEIGFQNTISDILVYARCGTPLNGGCVYLPDASVWKWLSATNRGSGAVNIVVRGTDDSGTSVGASQPIAVSIANDEIAGGLYYWTTSNGTGIMRYDFASPTETAATRFVGPELTGGKCVGCHALSRDGSKMVAEAGGQNSGQLLMLDVASSKPMVPFPAVARSTFESWSPAGDQFVGVYGDSGATNFNLMIFDGGSGSMIAPIAGTGTAQNPADHPDWSPDGKKIAYVKVGMSNTLQRMSKGAIELVTQTGGSWSAPVELVPALAGKNRYYPAFAPDSSFLVFDESTCANGASGDDCDADTDPTARLFAALPSASALPVLLARANAPGRLDPNASLTNSFPKWSPFVFQRTGEAGSRLMWVTFSSSRRFGLRDAPAGTGDEGTSGSLIWMAAIDPDQVAAGQDPSFPAFALPFQDFTTSNHIAQWTTQIVPPIQ